MTDRDGVIKFQLDFKKTAPLPLDTLRELMAWRQLFYRVGLIGQQPDRYDGVAYGNVSQRFPPFKTPKNKAKFVVSGSQTGGIPLLNENHFSLVVECQARNNHLQAEGPMPPSAEAMTHGTIYNVDPAIRWVMHIHSPDIWNNSDRLKLPKTDPAAPYGTPKMAVETERLIQAGRLKNCPVFVMGGHKDGVVSFGKTAEEAGFSLLKVFVQALAMDELIYS